MNRRGAILFPTVFVLLLAVRLSKQGTVITAHRDVPVVDTDAELTADEFDPATHPCRRNCENDAPPMECHYTFTLEDYHTMSKACYDCPYNLTDCERPHCIPANGFSRSILAVNRQMPGPSIQVCQGDRVIVDVINLLYTESTTIHWHGQHHVQTPYMDGVPYVSQCPISPGSTFRYDYLATEAGTHFWHSHSGFQRGDGVYGALIVRSPPRSNWHDGLYDFDEHNVLITDWTHRLGIDKFLNHHHAGGDNKPPSILINGLGRYHSDESNVSAIMPIATFTVKPNARYRFRLINAEFLNCPIELSIDNHTMLVISSDGRDIEPVEADSLVSYAGERFDFVIETNGTVDNYWMRFRGLMDCDERFTKAYQVAVLRYEGAVERDPNGTVTYEPESNNSNRRRVNALNEGTETNASISIPLLKSMDENDESNRQSQPDYQFYVSYDFYKKDNPHFHRKNLYGFYQVNESKRVLTPQLNHISMKLPPVALLPQRDFVDSDRFCNASSVRTQDCERDYCTCTHVLRVKLDSVVEIVLVDEGFAYDANHPFHLHGYQFRVIAMERVGKNITVSRVKELDETGAIRRNLDRAPLKDTVTVPDGGYTILRFHANNPGYWLFHCHIEFHAEVGMSLIFKVGENEDMLPVPQNFPTCGNWQPEESSHIEQSKNVSWISTIQEKGMEKSTNDTKDEISENSVEQFVRLLPEILKTFKISGWNSSSSTWNSVPYFLLSFCCLLCVVNEFV
ncbi:laccase-1-like isoform X2 [Ceratina calcarata]|uniref:Laccase-1-like isoform X2 n=1 Tax=Ceratina calcarata TaxID=156304 RepID=A0AAJ7W7Y2_9HYME|nr:laccase-1-like isoform X2 [Ceratina calcarata]